MDGAQRLVWQNGGVTLNKGKEFEMTKLDLTAIRHTLVAEKETLTANIQSE